jgi:hypothetical protein
MLDSWFHDVINLIKKLKNFPLKSNGINENFLTSIQLNLQLEL